MSLELARSAAERPLRLRKRPDLLAVPQQFAGVDYWAVKDPIALRYFHLRDEEYFLLGLLDGQASAADLRRAYAARYAPRRLRLPTLPGFLARLHREGLTLATTGGQAEPLEERRRDDARRRRWAALANLLAVRMPGLDPEPLLRRLAPCAGVFFSRAALLVGSLFLLATLLLAATHGDTLAARLPRREQFFTAGNAVWLAATLAATKLLHELGHALACRRMGAECHEIGLTFVVGVPTLYCNVSDAWMLPRKTARLAVSAAGIWVELLLAAAATWLWWASAPGPFQAACLNVMVVCSASTLLVNGNPFLRYDGYYLLADLCETPNLGGRARQSLHRLLARALLAVELPEESPLRERYPFRLAAYALASAACRLLVLCGLYAFARAALAPLRLERIADAAAAFTLAGLVAGPVWAAARFVRRAPLHAPLRRGAVAVRLLAAASLMALAGLLPWPRSVVAPVTLEPRDAATVYVSVPGRLTLAVRPGDTVAAGELLARLENPELEWERTRLRSDRNRQRLHLENLERQRLDPAAALQLPAAKEALADLETRLAQREAEAERLLLRAPVAGQVLPPPHRAPVNEPNRLPRWSGTPLDPSNLGCWLETGTILCRIAAPEALEATALVAEEEIEFVRAGQASDVELDQLPDRRLAGRVREIAEIDDAVSPTGGPSDAAPELGRAAAGWRTVYQVRIDLDEPCPGLRMGGMGEVRVRAGSAGLFTRLSRFVDRTFHFTR